MRRLVALSSTTRMRRPARSASPGGAGTSTASAAMAKANVEPWPGVDAAVRRPPMSATRRVEMASPRPVPP